MRNPGYWERKARALKSASIVVEQGAITTSAIVGPGRFTIVERGATIEDASHLLVKRTRLIEDLTASIRLTAGMRSTPLRKVGADRFAPPSAAA